MDNIFTRINSTNCSIGSEYLYSMLHKLEFEKDNKFGLEERNKLAKLFVDDIITLDQAKAQIEEKNIETLNRTIMQLKIKKQNNGNRIGF